MNMLFFDSVGGASGDMILAALIDLGVNRDELQRQLTSLSINPFDIQTSPFSDQGLRGIQVTIRTTPHPSNSLLRRSPAMPATPRAERVARQDEGWTESEHVHRHSPRGLAEIRALIMQSGLSRRVQDISINVFQRLAEAEAHVHGTTPDKVHFHEVGAVDSMVDIVGSCLGLELLNIDAVAVGPLPLGRGTVECDHGILPGPAPATVELLKGLPITLTQEPSELVTPTGAALLSTWKTMESVPAGSRIMRVGHGFGHRTLTARPNLLRALLMESPPKESRTDDCLVLECNLDDTIPELLGNLSNRLMTAGALDTFLTPVQMKKQRPGILLTVLCRMEQREAIIDLIFRESTTFGIREYPVQRTTLQRRHEEVDTPYGKVRVKIGEWKGDVITRAPEHDDCARLAQQAGIPVRTVYEAAIQAVSSAAIGGIKERLAPPHAG